MEQNELREWESRCIQEEPPRCTAGCPLGVDARAFVQAMVRGELRAAFAVLEKTMPLAGITARLCEAPCEEFCLRRELGGPVAIGLLEKTCCRSAPQRGRILRLPARGKAAAVLGAGPSSLVVAFDLAKKGYAVTVFPASVAGGWLSALPAEVLAPEILAEEIAILEQIDVRFEAAAPLSGEVLTALRGTFAALYIGRDDEVAGDLAAVPAVVDELTMATGEEGLFAGGIADSGHPTRYITSIAQGRAAALSMDRFLQGVSLTAARPIPRQGKTDLFTSTAGIAAVPRIEPGGAGAVYTAAEAEAEAARCLDCQCLECVKNCLFLKQFGAYPKVYARRIYNNEAIVKGVHQANTLINSCSLCGQCEILCPHDFSMARLCLEARQRMVAEKRMPPSAHAFALDEMRSANSPQCKLIRHAPGCRESGVMLFPGCQLAAIRPGQTLALYRQLLSLRPDTGIWLGCCGAPAHWAGRQDECSEIGERFRASWREMGQPTILTCCSSCLQMFRDHLPEVRAESVWTTLAAAWKAADGQSALPPAALVDPCTARHDGVTRSAVRALAAALRQPLAELPMSGELTECCGFGGLMENANPEIAQKVVDRRAGQTSAPLLTYCIMCREQLARSQRPVSHLLDLLFPEMAVDGHSPPLGISPRRENRRQLYRQMLREYFNEAAEPAATWQSMVLSISPEVAAIMETRRILADDVRRVLWQAGRDGRFFQHGRSPARLASARLGEVTFWVEYTGDGEDGYQLHNCWSHRMAIVEVAR